MTPAALLATLAARGVHIERHGDALRVRAPRGVLTETDKAELRATKPALLRLLGDPPAPPAPGAPPRLVCLCPPRRPGERFVLCALHALCGASPDPAAVAALEADVRHAIRQYQAEVATGLLGPGPLRVRGYLLSDYLDLDTLGRLIQTRGHLAEDAHDA